MIDSFVDRLVDAVGAGDALLAYSTLAMLPTRSDHCDHSRHHGRGLRMRSGRQFSDHSTTSARKSTSSKQADGAEHLLHANSRSWTWRAGPQAQRFAGTDFVASVDPVEQRRRLQSLHDVPSIATTRSLRAFRTSRSRPLRYLIDNGKHVLVEKPLWTPRTRISSSSNERRRADVVYPPTIIASSRTSCACAT